MTPHTTARILPLVALVAALLAACGGDDLLQPSAVDDGLYEGVSEAPVAREPQPRPATTSEADEGSTTGGGAATTRPEHPAPEPSRPAADATEISLDALAPLEFGMTPDEAARALDVRWLDDGSYDLFRREYECGYLQPFPGDFPPGVVFMFTGPDETLRRIDAVDPRWRSAIDVGVGDPIDGVLDNHRDATVEPDLYDPERRLVSLPADAQGVRYVFEVDTAGIVDGIRYGYVQETSWPEGCL